MLLANILEPVLVHFGPECIRQLFRCLQVRQRDVNDGSNYNCIAWQAHTTDVTHFSNNPPLHHTAPVDEGILMMHHTVNEGIDDV